MTRRKFYRSKSVSGLLLIGLWAGALLAQARPVDPGLTAHEWGTFTSIAGSNGQPVEWQPGIRPWDAQQLPNFVEHLNFGVFKQGLPAVVRMETPVLYFYSSHAVNLSVQVAFSKGLITEWYPHAVAPEADGGIKDADIYRKHTANGSISWDSVTVQPGLAADFPVDPAPKSKMADVSLAGSSIKENHYYAARQTSAVPLTVHTRTGDQHERFLFYRGVSMLPVPITARFTGEGNLALKNSLQHAIPSIIWFERRGARVGYRISEGIPEEAESVLEPPQLTAEVESLYGDLEDILVARGLYRDEAHAMVETWRSSWFEEGSRLFYIVPQQFVDSILPLTITPAPAQTLRVFVGRLELVSPATQRAVTAALVAKDEATLAKYGRFLNPIMKIITERDPAVTKLLSETPCGEDAGTVVASQRRR